MSDTAKNTGDLKRRDDAQFQHDVKLLLQSAEDTRLRYMKQHRRRNFATINMSILSMLIGGAGFGWFLLIKYNLPLAVLCMIAAIVPPIFLSAWTRAPLKAYIHSHKSEFMPKMANVLGGLKFYPSRGISAKIVNRTGVLPQYSTYDAEDCFIGKYKGVKIILSEARLYGAKKKSPPVFDGVFVLLELPKNLIEGHSIITADYDMVKKWKNTRWKKFTEIPVQTAEKSWDRFQVFSTKPETAALLTGDRLLKELAEAADIFDKAPLTAVLFAKKFIFIAIPYEANMFEASNMNIPVATQKHAQKCKREIEQLFEIVDVYEIYKSGAESTSEAAISEPVKSTNHPES